MVKSEPVVKSELGTAPEPFRVLGVGKLDGQTLQSTSTADSEALLLLDGQLPAVCAEALVMAAAAEELGTVVAAAGGPAFDAAGRRATRPLAAGEASLQRLPRPGKAPALLARVVPMLGLETSELEKDAEPAWSLAPKVGPYVLRPDVRAGSVVKTRLFDVAEALASLPAAPPDGRPTVLFLLPFLAVGGAERLLFDLLEGLRDVRCLVVTLDPHSASLGHKVDRCLELTPQVYTLGDWLPRRAAFSALVHLVRYWRVDTLVSWNGTVDFFDRAHDLRRRFPELRLLSQLYHDRGGWTARTSPRVLAAVDCHLAVNRDIASALERRGARPERIALVHHGVPIPDPVSQEESEARRAARRRELDLPERAVVVGSFIRLHAQKRPLEILRLARRFAASLEDDSAPSVYFLLVGDGPMSSEVDAELERAPIPNLLRLPMTREPLPLYDAVDICLMTSAYEGLPVFLLDGLARGLPGVAPSVGDIPLLFAGGGGLLAGSPASLNALEPAVRQLLDPAERARRGALGRATVEASFGLDRYLEDYRRQILPREGIP